VVARIVAAAEHDANVARMVRLDGDVSDCGKVRFGGPVPHGAGRIHVFMHDSRLGPRVTIQLSQNGTTRSALAASRCRKTVQLGVTWVTYRQAALLTAGGTPLCGRSYQRGWDVRASASGHVGSGPQATHFLRRNWFGSPAGKRFM